MYLIPGYVGRGFGLGSESLSSAGTIGVSGKGERKALGSDSLPSAGTISVSGKVEPRDNAATKCTMS